jgi:hypothetical protein
VVVNVAPEESIGSGSQFPREAVVRFIIAAFALAAITPAAGWAQTIYPDVEYIRGRASVPGKIKGQLIITESTIAFTRKDGQEVLSIPVGEITEVANSFQTDPGSFGRKLAFGIFASRKEEFLFVNTETPERAEVLVFKTKKNMSLEMSAKIKHNMRAPRGARGLRGARIGRRELGGTLLDPLALASCQHVAAHDLADDPGDERIPARLCNQPATPLELIQRRQGRVQRQLGDPRDLIGRDPFAQHRRGRQDPLGVTAQLPKAHPDRCDDGVGEVAGPGLIEGVERRRPAASDRSEVEPGRNRMQQLDDKQGQAG